MTADVPERGLKTAPASEATGTSRGAVLSLAQAWLPILTVVGGALWGLYTYLDHAAQLHRAADVQADKEATTRRVEARKPFLEKQLALYFETAQVVGKIVAITPNHPEWAGLQRRFEELYWSELTMVADENVTAAAVGFLSVLGDDYVAAFKNATGRVSDPKVELAKIRLQASSLILAKALRTSIERGWSGVSSEGK